MAKYEVRCSRCGEVSRVIELFGKSSARHEKIEWMEKTELCNKCWKETHPEEAAAYKADKEKIKMAVIGEEKGKLRIVLYGNTYTVKDNLKKNSWHFGEFELPTTSGQPAIMRALTMAISGGKIVKGWSKTRSLITEEDSQKAIEHITNICKAYNISLEDIFLSESLSYLMQAMAS